MIPSSLLVLAVSLAFIDKSLCAGEIKPWYWSQQNKPLTIYIKPSNSSRRVRSTDIADNAATGGVRRPFVYWIQHGARSNSGYDPGWYEEHLNRTTTYSPILPDHPPTTPEVQKPTRPPPHQPSYEDECPRDVIHDRFNGHGYFFSWEDRRSADLVMTWSQSLNFCRARCLEPVSIDSVKEHQFLAKHIVAGGVHGVWTSGRKCDFSGCDQEEYLKPIEIYGWFWEGSLVQLPPTTDRFDTVWSRTGRTGKPQPDNFSGKNGGEQESCLAILNNRYNDGVVWHDEVCSQRKPFICEERPYRYTNPHVISPHNDIPNLLKQE